MEKEITKVINFEVNPILAKRFDEMVHKKGLRRSETIRNLMNQYVESNEKCKCKCKSEH